MSGGTKPKTRRRVWAKVNPIEVALQASTAFTPAEIEGLMKPLDDAYEGLRTGCATAKQLMELAAAMNVAICIHQDGVVKVPGDELKSAQIALSTIWARSWFGIEKWKSPTLYAPELLAIKDLLRIYRVQIENVAANEYRRAVARHKAQLQTKYSRSK